MMSFRIYFQGNTYQGKSDSLGASAYRMETFGDKACHPERSEGSGLPEAEILRCAQDDMEDLSQVH